MVWHGDGDFEKTDLIVVPGGFSYGDYLRCGAMAAQSPVMAEVKQRAAQGVPVLAICNGFQIVTEAGLLPGALMRNAHLKFVCSDVHLKVETSQSLFTNRYQAGQVIRVPVAHAEGNYFADDDTLKRLEDRGQIAFRYCAPDGTVNGTRQSQRLDPQHRRRVQRDQDGDGADAASRERGRADVRRLRRQGIVRGSGRGPHMSGQP